MKTNKKIISIILAGIIASGLCGCTKNYTFEGGEITTIDVNDVVFSTAEVTEESLDYNVIEDIIDDTMIIDRTGSLVKVPDSINTIISASPAVTEILTGLGLGSKIIAADTWSSDVEGIDPSICTIDITLLNIEELVQLAPDVFVIGEINTDGTNDPYEQLKAIGTQVIYIPTSESIQAVKDDIAFIAEYTKTTAKGEDLIAEIDNAIGEVNAKLAVIDTAYMPKVYFELSAAPYLYSCGNSTFVDELITLCGGENIYADTMGWLSNSDESVIAANPDVIITSVKYDGYDYNEIKARVGWNVITAVKNSHVYQVDANSVSRPSQNIAKGIRAVAYSIYPELFAEFAMVLA